MFSFLVKLRMRKLIEEQFFKSKVKQKQYTKKEGKKMEGKIQLVHSVKNIQYTVFKKKLM